MNQTIRSRIEQIKRGAIPDGYKKTKVGIVPKEWTEHTLSEFFDFKNGLNKEKEAFGKGTPIVNYTDVWGKRGLLKENIKGKVLLSKNEIDLYKVEEGDVFFTRTSETIEEIGLSSVLLEPINDCVFSGFVLRARPKKAGIVKEYNIYCYSSAIMRHEITRKSSMTTRALTNGTLLGEVNINLPNQKEQEKIAEILQEQDRLIELKEKLIEEKKKQKQYLMDVLLTGKVRLPGFTDEWKKFHLRELCSIRTGRLDANAAVENGRYPFFTCSREELRINKYSFNGEAILLAGNGDVGHTKYYSGKFDAYQRTYVLMDFKINPKLIKCYIDMAVPTIVQKELQGGAMPYIKLSTLEKVSFFAPNDFNEQEAIIKDIELFAVELELLQKELEEQKRKKQSLMQLLLTGIVKVKA